MLTQAYTITSQAQLAADIAAISAAGGQAAMDTAYAFIFGNSITLTHQLAAIDLDAGSRLIIIGNGQTLSGAGNYQGFVVDAGNITIEDLTIAQAKAIGAAGATASGPAVASGGGAGLGGGLFIGSGATVALVDVSFTGDTKASGAGGTGSLDYGLSTGTKGETDGAAHTGEAGRPESPSAIGEGGASTVSAASLSLGGDGGVPGGSVATGLGSAGGGNGAGGDVFVQQGAALTIGGVSENLVAGVPGGSTLLPSSGPTGLATASLSQAGTGAAFGSGLFIQGDENITLEAAPGQTLVVTGVIGQDVGAAVGASQPVRAASAPDSGQGGLVIGGGGTVALAAVSSYDGGTTVTGGTTLLDNPGHAGAGSIAVVDAGVLATQDGVTLALSALVGELDIAGLPYVPGASFVTLAHGVLRVTAGLVGTQFNVGTGVAGPFVVVPDGNGIALIAEAITVTDGLGLNAAIREVDQVSQALAAVGGHADFTIDIANNIALAGDLPEVVLGAGSSLTINGAGETLDDTGHRGLVAAQGALDVDGLTIADTDAAAAASATVAPDDAAGGIAGPGGDLFVASGAVVTLTGVTFSADTAVHDTAVHDIAGTGAAGGTDITGAPAGDVGTGGDIFVQQGGVLAVQGGSIGVDLFIQGDNTVTLAAVADQTLAVTGTIVDQDGVWLLHHDAPTRGTSGDAPPSDEMLWAGAGTIAIEGSGTVSLEASNRFTGGILLEGGTLVLGAPGAAGSGPITYSANADPTTIFTPDDAPTGPIDAFQQGDTLIISDFTATASIESAPTLELIGGGVTVSLDLPGALLADLSIVESGGETVITSSQVLCFAAGTRIATPAGERAVETLRAGDAVLVLRPDGGIEPGRLRWVGRRRLDLAAHPEPELAAPIRLRAGALAPDRPARDLLLSPDHCLFLDGVLLRAFRLLNGVSVVQERPAGIDYLHLELDRHALLLAEGVAAESYLDEGLRAFFAGEGAIPGPLPMRSVDACAPHAPDDAFAERIWRRIAARAGAALSMPTPSARALAVVAGGRRLRPAAVLGRRHLYALPGEGREVRLISAAARPTDSRPWAEDRRRLGVRVAGVRTDGARLPLDGPPAVAGWWAAEADGARWTDGDARLRLPPAMTLEIELAP